HTDKFPIPRLRRIPLRGMRDTRIQPSHNPTLSVSSANDRALGGRLGMFDFVEPRVRRLVADHLGVGTEELTRDVSLADELAVDSLDLVELALALEAEFGISLSEATLDGVRTYGELADAVCILARLRREAELGAERAKEPLIWARVVLPQSHGSSELQRAGWLTPYTAETIAEDALRGGRGTRLEVSVS